MLMYHIRFHQTFISSALKTNSYLYIGVMAGCLRIAKKSVFTDLNNFRTDSILSYDDEVYFGFTEDEIISILDVYNMQDRLSAVKDWYDGWTSIWRQGSL